MGVLARVGAWLKSFTTIVAGRRLTVSGSSWDQGQWPNVGGWQWGQENLPDDFVQYVQDAYKANGIVFACIVARQLVFAEARFQWREFRDGRPGDLFGSAELGLLENPWPGGTTGELLARMEQDASLAGNSYWTVADAAGRLGKSATGPGRMLVRMRPDWVTIVIASASGNPNDLDARIGAYWYRPPGGTEVLLLPEEVAHYSPIPDPEARFRGMSWLTPVLTEVASDKAATRHKWRFFTNGATPGWGGSVDPTKVTPEQFLQFVELFNRSHTGVDKAYKPAFLYGIDPKSLGTDLKQLDFKVVQGAGETRIAAAARVHPVIVGLSEGMQGSSLNAGNFSAARRGFADGTLRPLWRIASASLQTLVTPPRAGASLWYDDRDIAYLREDAAALAEIRFREAQTIRALTDAGYTPDSVIAAVEAGDWSLLVHTGLFSVQLQPPTTTRPALEPAPA